MVSVRAMIARHFDFLGKRRADGEMAQVIADLAEKTAFKALALHIAVSYIANALSKCEIKVYRNGSEVRDFLYWRLNVSPNPNQSGAQFVNDMVTRLCLDGDALVVPHRGEALYVATAFYEDPKPLREHIFTGIAIDGKQIARSYKAADAYHFKLESASAKGFVDELYRDYGRLMASAIEGFIQTHGRKYKLVLGSAKVGDPKFNEEWEKVVKKQLEEFIKSPNAVYPQFEGYDLQEMRHEAEGQSGDILAMRKEVFDVCAQAYKIPTSMMYGNTNNTAEVVRQFLTFAVDPIARMMEDELTRKTFTYEEWAAGSRIAVDTKSINHVDIFDVAEKVDKLISSGVFCIDDVLIALGYVPLNTEFSRAHYMTKNYEPAEEALNRLAGGGEQND